MSLTTKEQALVFQYANHAVLAALAKTREWQIPSESDDPVTALGKEMNNNKLLKAHPVTQVFDKWIEAAHSAKYGVL